MRRDGIGPVSFLVPFVVSLLLCSVLVLSLSGCQAAGPQYPTREITYVVPSQQGTGTDLTCRTLLDVMPKYWPEAKFNLLNNSAGGGTGAAVDIMKGKPDGYTMGMDFIMPFTLQPWLMGDQIPYKSVADFTVVHQVFSRSNVLAVLPDSKYNTVVELIDEFKSGKRTEPFTYAGRGVGNAEHLMMSMLEKAVGLQGKGFFKVVPYTSDGEAAAAVLGGHIEATNFMWASTKSLIAEKRLKPLVAFMPFPGMEQYGIKTAKQLGYDVEFSPRHYHLMPKGTPQEFVTIVDQKFKQAMEDPKFSGYLDTIGDFLLYDNAENATKYLTEEREREGVLARELGLAK